MSAAGDLLAERLEVLHAVSTRAVHRSVPFAEEALPPGMDLQDAAGELAERDAIEAPRLLRADI